MPGSILLNSSVADIGMLWYATQYAIFVSALVTPSMALLPWAMYWPIPPVVAVVVTLGDVLANPTRRCRRCYLGRCPGQSHPSLPSLLPWAMYWPIPPVVAVVAVVAFDNLRCRVVSMWRFNSAHPPDVIVKSHAHNVQRAFPSNWDFPIHGNSLIQFSLNLAFCFGSTRLLLKLGAAMNDSDRLR